MLHDPKSPSDLWVGRCVGKWANACGLDGGVIRGLPEGLGLGAARRAGWGAHHVLVFFDSLTHESLVC